MVSAVLTFMGTVVHDGERAWAWWLICPQFDKFTVPSISPIMRLDG